MPLSPQELLARLDSLGIAYVIHAHPPLYTVADSKALRGELPGGHCKSLFLKGKRGELYLVVALEDRAVDLKRLRKALGAANLSFGSPELLHEVLGVKPGAVTPFGLANDTGRRVHVVLDKAMLAKSPLNYHPLTNDQTTAITPDGLLSFIAHCGHTPRILDFDALDTEPAPPA
ncbi:MAG: prolyl-tRNA synthetase associated domain-containing protein [Alphaproteobacteria bacterium]|nr:prolyl-tRNA synthetase associated domain-containing protein [Alphaproteobacteria bacterium]